MCTTHLWEDIEQMSLKKSNEIRKCAGCNNVIICDVEPSIGNLTCPCISCIIKVNCSSICNDLLLYEVDIIMNIWETEHEKDLSN